MTEFLTADEHYFHDAIIEHCKRPFKNYQQMNKDLINNHNSVVGLKDTVWHIGDFTMLEADRLYQVRKVFEKLNGIHHLVLGNHDEMKVNQYLHIGFATVHSAMWFDRGGYTFVLAHDLSIYTVTQNMGDKTYLLHGHIHEFAKHFLPGRRAINVGVDVWDFKPVSFEAIINLIKEYEE